MSEHLAMVAQIAGAIGDTLNLVGGGILALDILWRPRERTEEQELDELGKELQKFRIPVIYKGMRITEPGAVPLALMLRAVRRGKLGVGLLASGFLFLLIYRALEIVVVYRGPERIG